MSTRIGLSLLALAAAVALIGVRAGWYSSTPNLLFDCSTRPPYPPCSRRDTQGIRATVHRLQQLAAQPNGDVCSLLTPKLREYILGFARGVYANCAAVAIREAGDVQQPINDIAIKGPGALVGLASTGPAPPPRVALGLAKTPHGDWQISDLHFQIG